jgi:MFS family permease
MQHTPVRTDVDDEHGASGVLVAGAFLMTMSSSFGQTYFIALFAPWLKDELHLTDGEFGSLYMVGTIASAIVLVWAGKLADRFRIRGLAVCVLLCLAATCAAMAAVPSGWLLLPILFALRLFGQGALGHLAITGVGRWFVRRRGRMMSFAVLGFPSAQATTPLAAVALIGLVGWRETWLIAAATLCLASVPLVILLLSREPAHDRPPVTGAAASGPATGTQRQWTREEVLKVPEFFAVLTGIAAPSFVMTGIFFHQAHLVTVKGWTLAWFAAWFPAYAGTSVVAALLTGWLVDRFDVRRLLPLFLLPMAASVSILIVAQSLWAVPAFMVLGAMTNGSASTLIGTLWAHLFGTRHLGAIRSVAFATQVLASALAPGLLGLLIDLGVRLEHQLLGMLGYTLLASLWLKLLVPRLYRLTQE